MTARLNARRDKVRFTVDSGTEGRAEEEIGARRSDQEGEDAIPVGGKVTGVRLSVEYARVQKRNGIEFEWLDDERDLC